MSELTPLREAVDTLAGRATSPDFGELQRRANRRGRRRVVAIAAVAGALIAGSLYASARVDDARRVVPLGPPPIPAVLPVAVWYDANGLHHGQVVERTPVDLLVPERLTDSTKQQVISTPQALALVRTGALYLDPRTGDVWFHPWGGQPHVVGHHSVAGPGGDPEGDTAAWFEGRDLVVYDTATGREISRTSQASTVAQASGDHFPAGNGFLQVSADRVVWRSADEPLTYSLDVHAQATSVVAVPEKRFLADVQGRVEVLGGMGRSGSLHLVVGGGAAKRYPDLETHVRLSPTGNYLLAVEGTETRHAAAIVDTNTGEMWRVPKNAYPWIAWSYGDMALVETEDGLLACDAARHVCRHLPAQRPLLVPTN